MAEAQPVKLPKGGKLKKVRVSSAPFSGDPGDQIVDRSTSYVSTSIRDIRTLGTLKAIRALARVNGLVSSAVQSFVSLGMSGYTVSGYHSGTHLFSKEGTQVAETVLASMDTLNDYSDGYNDKRPLQQLLETLLKETIITGACAGELVLNDHRTADRIVPLPVDDVSWTIKKDQKKFPVQAGGDGEDIELNIPTVWVEFLHQEATSVIPRSMLESCLNTVYIVIE